MKTKVLESLYEVNRHITMIGGYGEHIVRPRVTEEADHFVYNMLQLDKLIQQLFNISHISHYKKHCQCKMRT